MEKPDLDPQLLDGLCKGGKEARGIFWRRFHTYLCAQVTFQGVRSDEDIEEIVEDIVLRVFGSINKFRQESRFTTWLYTLTRNAILDYYKSPKNRTAFTEVEVSDIADQWVSPDGNTRKVTSSEWSEDQPNRPVVLPASEELSKNVSEESVQRIHSAILKLPLAYRDVLLCRLVIGCSMKETAELLSRSEAATKMLSSRAMNSLREVLKNDSYFSIHEKGGDQLERPV